MIGILQNDGYGSVVHGHFKEVVRLGWGGAKSNLLPGAVLWVLGIILVISYYQVQAVGEMLDRLGEFKLASSPWFGIISTALFGSLIPWIVQAVFLKGADKQPFRHVPWLLLFWGIHGWQVDWLYRIQAGLFGNGIDFMTILKKTLVDEFVWVPFLAVWQLVLGYLLIEKKGSLLEFRAALKKKPFLDRAIPLMIANWVVWIPAVSLIYLFPLPLQLPLMNIILALWCLILAFFAKNVEATE
jgi:hypothetical protein|tara:strand:- start:1658 stop:2383 length:726 start_codon:yes stop_codon:yes gene_type:complete